MKQKTKQFGFWLTFITGLFVTIACSSNSNNYPYGYTSPYGGGNATASYSSLQTNLFNPYCVRCHQQFGSYQGVRNDLNNVYNRVVLQQNMPQGGGLNPSLIQALATWAQNGAPYN